MQTKEYSREIGGKKITAQFSDLAEQASGSVILHMGNTTVLATAVMSMHEREGIDYFPLTVDYEEKFYAAGAILGSRFMRREGRPSEEAILTGRVVDRTIRPLFDQWIRNEVQVVITVLAVDEDDPDILAVNAASLALATSDIPWHGPVSAVRIGRGKESSSFLINPNYAERSGQNFDLVACGKDGKINMVEVGAEEVSEHDTVVALEEAQKIHAEMQKFQKDIVKAVGKEKKLSSEPTLSAEAISHFEKNIAPKLQKLVFSGPGASRIYEYRDKWVKELSEEFPETNKSVASEYFERKVDKLLHDEAIDNNTRADGRAMDEIRPLFAKAGGVSDVLHGSGIFYRGGTHVFSALTLGGPEDSLIIDSMEEQDCKKHFMHHYNFPPFSTGETGRIGGMNRRMIGHGALAEKALLAVIPEKEKFPYTIRLVSESMASNGSTSMGSVCGSTLALMDGGVPIKSPVAGIASGLVMRNEKEYKLLTDIQGPEDHYGDMDFKVAGTRDGITAIQMDVKVDGIPIPILAEALETAKKARLQIIDTIESAIATPRENISPRAPEIVTLSIKPDQIGLVIGPGGKTINGIKDETGVEGITVDDDGSVFITGKNGSAQKARDMIAELTHEYEAGERFEGEVTRLMDFGAFVKIGTNTEGLVHISEIAPFRIKSVDGILKVGDTVPVVIKEIDEKKRINLSIKSADPDFAKKRGINPEQPSPPPSRT